MMREIPQQPRNLDPIDVDTLAWYGRHIERWDSMMDNSKTLEQRCEEMIQTTIAEVDALIANLAQEEERRTLEIDALQTDIDDLLDADETEEAFRLLAQNKIEFYKEARKGFIKEL